MKFSKQAVWALVMMSAVVASAAITEVSDATKIGGTYGNDTLKYTGATATATGKVTCDAGAVDKATTIEVATPDAVLTLAGGLAINNVFFKYGPGTLTVNPGDGVNVNSTRGGSNYNAGTGGAISWDDGVAGGSFMDFNVAEGTFRWAGTGKFYNYNLTVGNNLSAGAKDAHLVVAAGEVELGNLLIIDQNNNRTGTEAKNDVTINQNGTMTVQSVWAGISDGNRTINAEATVNGGTMNITRNYWAPYGQGASTVTVKNGGKFNAPLDVSNLEANDDYAVRLGILNFTSTGTLEVTGEGSEAAIGRLSAIRGKSVVKVNDGGVLKVDSPSRTYLRTMSQTIGGKLEINGGKLEPLASGYSAEWFTFGEQHTVGANGGTVEMSTLASLGGWLSGSGTMTKLGAGMVTMMPSAAPINVSAGSVGFHAFNKNSTDNSGLMGANGSVTVAANAYVRAMGAGALGNMTLNAGDGNYVFGTTGLDHDFNVNDWSFVNAAMPRSDGWFRLTDARRSMLAGAAWRKTKMDVSKSFTVSFDYYVTKLGTGSGAYVPFGMAAVWQTAGYDAQKMVGANYRSLGYANPKSMWANSYAVGYDAADGSMRSARINASNEGYFLTGDGEADVSKVDGYGQSSFARPVTITIAYDADNHKITTTLRSGRGNEWTMEDATVNLAERCGANEAYFGFTASDWASDSNRGEHFVGNIRISADSPASTTAVGGIAKIEAGKTFKAELVNDAFNRRWNMNELNFVHGATLNVTGPSTETLGFLRGVGASSEDVLEKTGSAGLALGNAFGTMSGTLKVSGGSLTLDESSTGTLLAANTDNWWLLDNDSFENTVGATLNADNSITVGRNVNKGHLFNDLVALKHKLDISKAWKISWHDKMEAQVAYGSKWLSFIIHNDPRGYEAYGADHGAAGGIANSVTIAWQEKSTQTSYGSGYAFMWKGAEQTELWREYIADKIDVKVGTESGSETSKEVDMEVSYDPDTTTLTFKMTQGENVFTKSQVIDLAAVVGNEAYLAFGATSAALWFDMRQTISNLSYTSGEGETSAYVDKLVLNGANNDNTIILNATTADKVFKLANTLTIAAGAQLTLQNADATSAIATAGAVDSNGGAVTQNGGVFQIGASTLANVRSWNLTNGAKLMVPAGTEASVKKLKVNGVYVAAGTYTKDNCDFIVGDGSLKVTVQAGLMMFIQ